VFRAARAAVGCATQEDAMLKSFVVVIAAALALPAVAGDIEAAAAPAAPPPPAPTAEEVKKVTEYFLRGKDGGPVLLDFIACKKTGKNQDGKLTCEEPIAGNVKKGEPLIAYVRFFVPKGAKYEDLKVKFLLNGEVRSTSDFTLSEAWSGYANFKQTTASKTGNWEMQVLRGDTVLSTAKVTVE
jgi:hypothetical protein